ncbi:helicase-related protein [Caldicellulosiruptoraceae bacterium PP1]
MINQYYIKRLSEIIDYYEKKPSKKIIFFKGFPGSFYKELYKIKPIVLFDKKYINKYGYIDIEKLEKNKNKYLAKLFNFDKEIAWGFYEELIMIAKLINNIKVNFNWEIYIVNNNLFSNYYPIDIEKQKLDEYYDYCNNDKENEEDNIFSLYYADIKKLYDDIYGITYINIDDENKYEEIKFFENIEIETYDKCDFNLKISLNSKQYDMLLTDVQKGKEINNVNLQIDSKNDIEKLKPLVRLFKESNINFKITYNERFIKDNIDNEIYLNIFKRYWGMDKEFRKLKIYKNPDENKEVIEMSQGQIIEFISQQAQNALNNTEYNDIFITAPTGAGKSLLFQIPAIYLAEYLDAITIVVTPLIALMRDQVSKLKFERGIEYVACINSEINYEEKQKIINDIREGKISIIYLSPEMLLANSINNIIGSRKIGLFVIDEAHLVTTWGRDFRADYWFLGDYLEKLRRSNFKFPILCLTATAVYNGPEDMVNETIKNLNLYKTKIFLGSVRRENIEFCINKWDNQTLRENKERIDDFKLKCTIDKIKFLIDNNKKGIIYCPYVSQVDDIYNSLDDKYKKYVGRYYGSMDKHDKLKAEEDFKYGNFKVIICTKAFGMGIDIQEIEYIYHYAPTGNLSDYVQEIGRAARDKKIKGIACIDFTDKDMKYVRVLYGLSGLKQYQIKEVMSKLYEIYKTKKRNKFLISADNFSYLFDYTDIENKVKSALLLISKDLHETFAFPVINIRPKSMFTKNFVCVPYEIEEKFIRDYGVYTKRIKDYESRIIPSNNNLDGDIIEFNVGNIYEVDMAALWENHFNHLTFAQFKWKFYEGDLFNYGQKLYPRFNLKIHYNKRYDEIKTDIINYIEKLIDIFYYFKLRGSVFNRDEFRKKCIEKLPWIFRNLELTNILLDLFVAETSQNIAFNQNIDRLKFIQERRNLSKDEKEYRIMNSNFATLKNYINKEILSAKPNQTDNVYSTYLALHNYGIRNHTLLLAMLLEIFNLASYEIIGGKNTEIFIRINDPNKLARLIRQNYSNSILTDINKRRENSQAILREFLLKEMTNEERWNFIEDYFLNFKGMYINYI